MLLKKLLSIALCLPICYVSAQDRIYYSDGKIVERKITEITAEEIKATVLGDAEVTYSTRRSQVLFAFNNTGNFLVMSPLSNRSNRSQIIIDHFLSNDPVRNTSDKILTVQNEIIPCNYASEDGSCIAYSANGKPGKIPLSEVALIIFRNGKHRLYKDVNKAYEVLSTLQQAYDEVTFGAVKQKPLTKNGATAESFDTIHLKSNDTIDIVPSPRGTTPGSISKEMQNTLFASAQGKSSGPLNDKQEDDDPGEVPLNEYSERALHKTENLIAYIKVICDKSSEIDDINKAMKGALELFADEDAWVEVSSKNTNQVKRVKIKDYLNCLKLVNYRKVDIEWMNIQFVSRLRKGEDSNYYGVITFEQEFRGLRNNNLIYKDRTRKNMDVLLKTMPVSANGKTISKFDVLLSNIGVVETR